MKNPARCEKVGRAFALLSEAADNILEAKVVVNEIENDLYSKILGDLHNRIETEMQIVKKWFENEQYELLRKV